jgi:hypothetical protein
MIRFGCPNCKAYLQAPGPRVGTKVQCPHCHQRIVVPGPPPAQNKTLLGESLPQVPVNDCPGCRSPMTASPEYLGRWVQCPKCGTGFVAVARGDSIYPPLDPVREPVGQDPDYSYAAELTKSYTNSAALTMILYWLCWPIGLVMNLVYLSEANQTHRAVGHSPAGKGCLIALLVVCFAFPMTTLLIILLVVVAR